MGFRRNRLVAFVAAIALIACAAVYAAHGDGDGPHEKGQCDLCLHFSGTAGSPPHAAVVAKPVLVVRAPPSGTQPVLPTRRKVGTHLPRAPPGSIELV